MSMKNSNDTNRNRTHDLPTCSAVPQPTAPPRTPVPSSADVKERVQLYLYSPSGPSWPLLRWTLPLFYCCQRYRRTYGIMENILSDLTEFEVSKQLIAEVLNIKFHANPHSGSRADICGQTDGQTDSHDIPNRRLSPFMWIRLKTYTDKTTRTYTLDCGINTSLLPDIQALCSLHVFLLLIPITRLEKFINITPHFPSY